MRGEDPLAAGGAGNSALLRPRSLGELLDAAFGLYRQNFTTLVGASLVLIAPVLMGHALSPVLGALLSLIALPLIFASSLRVVGDTLAGRQPNIGAALYTALVRGPLLAVNTLAVYLLVAVLTMPILFVAVLVIVLVTGVTGMAITPEAAGVAGITLLIVSAALVSFCMLAIYTYISLFAPIWIYETRFLAVRRSFTLVRGAFIKCMLANLISWLLRFLPVLALAGATIALTGGFEAFLADGEADPLSNVLSTVLTAVIEPFGAAVIALLYVDRRTSREGADLAPSDDDLPERIAR